MLVIKPHRRLLVFAAVLTLGGGAWLAWYVLDHSPQWRASRRLAEADDQSSKAYASRLDNLKKLFVKGRSGARRFAEEALSWKGKWALVSDKLGLGDGDHAAYLAASFSRHIFTGEELKGQVEAAIKGYLLDLEGIESDMLVKLRADLDELASSKPSYLGSDEAFKQEYRRLAAETAKTVEGDLKVTVGREVGMLVATEVATQISLRVAAYVAAEMGVESAVLGAGAASSVATFGVGMVAAVVIDYLLDAVFRMAGYDPQAEIAQKVIASLDKLEQALIDGKGGLRQELSKIHEARLEMRKAVVQKLLAEGGAR